MDEKRKIFLTIVGGLVGLFFLSTRFYLSIAKENKQLQAEYKKLKQQVKTTEKIDVDQLNSLEKRIEATISVLEPKFPSRSKLNLAEQLTKVPKGAKIIFEKITQRNPQLRKGYQVFVVDVNMKAQFYDYIKYLQGIEASPLLIGIGSLKLIKSQKDEELLNIYVTFSGFRLNYKAPPVTKYLQEQYTPFDKERLGRLLQPIKLRDSSEAVSILKYYDPFFVDYQRPIQSITDIPIAPSTLSLRGILHIADEKAALINDTVVKVGDKIGGMEVAEIQDYRVILIGSGKKYILKMGVDNGFIKP